MSAWHFCKLNLLKLRILHKSVNENICRKRRENRVVKKHVFNT